MRRPSKFPVVFLSCMATAAAHATHEHEQLPELTVSGQRSGYENFIIRPENLNAPAADSAQLLTKVPGANVNRNGMVTGLAQYRGMYGDRVNLVIDGTKISSGGPNAMDPGLAYIPRAQLESLEVIRGIAPVSSGNETIGGTIKAKSTNSQFGQSDEVEYHGLANLGVHSVDQGYDFSTLMSVSNQNHRAHISASRQDGDDYRFDGGEVTPSEHDRNNYEVGYGFKQGGHEFGLEYLKNDTNNNGTPALPMDIVYVNGDIGRATYKGQWNEVKINSKIYWSQIDHLMSNFTLRLPPLMNGGAGPATMQRFSWADSESYGYGIDGRLDLAGGELAFGIDGHLAEHDADVFDPRTTSFLIRNYNEVQRDVFGLFGEWNGAVSDRWNMQLGVRFTHVRMDSGLAFATGFPMPPLQAQADALATAFNAADRSVDDNNVDVVLQFDHALRSDTDIQIGLARKTRSPSYQERYLWLPLQSTGGLADGNNYIGDINLDQEVSYQFELGLDWHAARFYFTPRAFYHHVNDYIQGDNSSNASANAFNTMVTNMLGSNSKLLQFTNVDARLYGMDAGFGYQITDTWHFDGTVSVVKGERRDNGDNLFRIAPVNARIGLTHEGPHWAYTVETELYLEKDDVSAVTNERETAGYALLNVFGHYRVPDSAMTLTAGIDNLLDKKYTPHLSGINRVRGVDVAPGQRIPAPGINAFATVGIDW